MEQCYNLNLNLNSKCNKHHSLQAKFVCTGNSFSQNITLTKLSRDVSGPRKVYRRYGVRIKQLKRILQITQRM